MLPKLQRIAALSLLLTLLICVVRGEKGDVSGKYLSPRMADTLDGVNLLAVLAVGPYPSAPIQPVAMEDHSGHGLSKRQQGCPSNYHTCNDSNGRYCCPLEGVCAKGGCCPRNNPINCGKACCLMGCKDDSTCACPGTSTACGILCCSHGCAPDGQNCACPAVYPVRCTDYCCPKGSICIGNGKCRYLEAASLDTRHDQSSSSNSSDTQEGQSMIEASGADDLMFMTNLETPPKTTSTNTSSTTTAKSLGALTRVNHHPIGVLFSSIALTAVILAI